MVDLMSLLRDVLVCSLQVWMLNDFGKNMFPYRVEPLWKRIGVYFAAALCIFIARAILKDAPIVIFDEATSYSDIENEHKIQLALQNLLKGKTTIMIAHRLHTIRDADKIVVFQDGTVAEQGTHQELVKKGGVYGRMWEIYTQATIGKEAV